MRRSVLDILASRDVFGGFREDRKNSRKADGRTVTVLRGEFDEFVADFELPEREHVVEVVGLIAEVRFNRIGTHVCSLMRCLFRFYRM